jgi:hypothetical protein
MITPNIDTFEHDVASEIKNKEASIGSIAAAGGEIGNESDQRRGMSYLSLVLISAALVLGALLVLYFGITYYMNKVNPTENSTPVVIPTKNNPALLNTISPYLVQAFGVAVTNVEHSQYGYTITFNSYSPVFAYMLNNESEYADDIAKVVGSARDTSTTTAPFIFTDTTISNQNMRVGTSGPSTVIYAFVDQSHLVISSTTEGILALRNAILH